MPWTNSVKKTKFLITNQILKLVCFSDRTTAAAKFYKMEQEAFLTVEWLQFRPLKQDCLPRTLMSMSIRSMSILTHASGSWWLTEVTTFRHTTLDTSIWNIERSYLFLKCCDTQSCKQKGFDDRKMSRCK